MKIDFELATQKAFFIAMELIKEKKVIGDDYVALNPTRQDRNFGSFKIKRTPPYFWIDFATGDKGDGLSLLLYLRRMPRTKENRVEIAKEILGCLLYTSPSPRDS